MPQAPSRGVQLSSGSGSWRDGDRSGLDPAEVVTRPGGTRPIAPVVEGDGVAARTPVQEALLASSAGQTREPQVFRTPTGAFPAWGARP